MRTLALVALAALGVVAAGLPASGARRDLPRATTDRPDDIVGAQIHAVYVVPADGTDRALDTNGAITASVKAWNGWLASQSGGKGSFRLDTSGGALDITFFRDSHTDAEIRARGAFVRDQLEQDLHAAGINSSGKLYAVYYDGTSTNACGGGAWPPTLVGNVAALYLHGLPDQPVPCDRNTLAPNGGPGYFDFSMLHEIMHTLGFVPTCAPHQVAAGHVSDAANDLMYAGSQPWQLPPTLDVGHNDYFSAGIAGCLDLASSAYLAADAPATTTTTTAATTTAATTTAPVALRKLTVVVKGKGTVKGGSISCPRICRVSLRDGARTTLTAKPGKGYKVSAWGGACSGKKPTCSLTLHATASVRATFVKR